MLNLAFRKSLLVMAPMFLVGCVAVETSEEETDDETSAIQEHIDAELTVELEQMTDLGEIETYLCRRGDLSEGIFSLRSFEGRLCQDRWVSGLKLVGGAALLICWENNLEDFHDSHCAENALEDYALDSINNDAIVSQMSDVVAEYEAASGAGSNSYYAGAKNLFCLIPKTLLGPGESIHDLWCGP